MNKVLLEKEKDLYKLLDEIYNIIPNNDINKAVYQSKEEQYEYQTCGLKMPPSYPCVIIYDCYKSNYSNRMIQHLYNKDYYGFAKVIYVTLDDFKLNK